MKRTAGDLDKKAKVGQGKVDLGGHEPKYLRLLLDEQATEFLRGKREEIETEYGVQLSPPDEAHVTIALGDELQEHSVPDGKIERVTRLTLDVYEFGDVFIYNTPKDGKAWVVPVSEKNLVRIREFLGLPDRVESFNNYSFHATLGYEEQETRVAAIVNRVLFPELRQG